MDTTEERRIAEAAMEYEKRYGHEDRGYTTFAKFGRHAWVGYPLALAVVEAAERMRNRWAEGDADARYWTEDEAALFATVDAWHTGGGE